MSALSLILILIAQVALVIGQVFLKHAMAATTQPQGSRAAMIRNIAAGTGMLTLWFLLWMGLLQKLELSFVYPFEGISPVLLVIAATVLLKEKLTLRTWVGVVLIALGTAMVGMS